eukprot:CAMPEP_0172927506 /NCGR_PEP_ID=MMETSP1075-20121228/217498_1 /TAXON_ID=2916 /ORGANISM="Ceratium fusus, Strain PA161109" /LENGTH=383 /DNA_ID=CAMNT_0013788763 /DNA_START=495 /DNA_END=1644 /DNA_ORIENTATION=+
MALRATTRQWAVMTGTAWTADCQRQELCQVMWEDVKAARIATYEQDLHVASAFQFFAVGCFGQVCKQALKAMVNNSGNERDSRILRPVDFTCEPNCGYFHFWLGKLFNFEAHVAHDPLASRTTEFLHTVVLGMPLVFVTMALRATTRQWAVMTGTAWTADCQRQELCQVMWEDVKAARIATYEQDLHVASAFQFFAVGCFGQVCKQALNAMVNNSGSERDSRILRQLAVLGIWTFVGLGIVQTVANIIFAMISSDPDKIPFVAPIQSKVTKTLDPVFLCATVLSVINMFLLSRIEEVERVLPRANQRFHATRALLLIGQGQITVLSAFVTSNAGANPVIKALQHFNIIKDVPFDLGIHQIRLLHSSLLCFECLMVAIVNHIVW